MKYVRNTIRKGDIIIAKDNAPYSVTIRKAGPLICSGDINHQGRIKVRVLKHKEDDIYCNIDYSVEPKYFNMHRKKYRG